MSTVPVDIRVGVQKGSVLRKLEKQILRLEKTAADLIVGFNTRTATRQLQGVDKQLGLIQADAKDIQLGFRLNRKGLTQAQAQINGLSATGGGGSGGGFASTAAAEAVGGIAAASGLANATKEAGKISAITKENIARYRVNNQLLEEANQNAEKFAEIQERVGTRKVQESEAQRKVNIQQGQVTRLTNQQNKARAAGRKITEGQVKALVDAQDLVKGTRAELNGAKTSMRLLADQAVRFETAAKGFPGSGLTAPVIPPRQKRGAGTALRGTTKKVGAALTGGSAIAGLGAGAALTSVIKGGADLKQLELRLKSLSTEYGEYDQIQKLVARNAETFNQSQRESAAGFASVYARLRPLGIELEQIQTTFAGFNSVAIANGASAQEASSAFLQLSQALGSGRLQGDEFRSISEQVPGILRLVADEMGVTVGELKKLGSEGAITSDILINSLAKGFEENKDKISDIIALSPAQKFKTFGNAVSDLGDDIGTDLLPAVTPLVEGLTDIVGIAGRLPGPIKTLGAAFFGLATAIGAAAGAANLLGISLSGKAIAAFGILAGKIALVAAPLAALALIFEDNKVRKESFDEAMKSDSLDVVEGKITQTNEELNNMKRALKLLESLAPFRGQAADVQDLKKRIDEAQVKVDLLTQRRELFIDVIVAFPNFDQMGAGFSDDLKDELEKLGLDYTPGKAVKPIKPKGGGGSRGGGSGPAPRESQLPELNQQITASEKLLALDRQILDAQYEENTALVQQLEAARILTEYENELAAIALEKIPAVEKQAKGTIALTAAMGEQAELADQIRTDEKDRATTLKELLTGFDREIELAGEKDRHAKALKQIEHDILDLRDQGILKTPEEVSSYRERAQAAAEVTKEMSGAKQMLSDSYDIVSGELTDSIGGLIDGTKEWGDVLSDIAGQLGKMFLNAGFSGLGSILGFADGGRPPMGQVSVVGERGPELFVPDSAGTVLSNDQSKAALANYSGGNASTAMAMAPMAANVTYNGPTLNFEGDKYIPRSEAPALVAAGAKQGQARAMNTLKNSRSQRQKLGM